MQKFLTTIRVGTFLGMRQLRRANIWTTLLIVFIMMLTFLNMVVVSGILVGLIDGGNIANREQYSGNVIMTKLSGNPYINNTQNILQTLPTIPGVTKWNERYSAGAQFEANYLTRTDFNTDRDTIGTALLGIDVEQEDNLTNLSKYVIEGTYLDPNQSGYVMIGSNMLQRFSSAFGVLGNMIGLIGIIVASITIFIVIFINAVTRRKYIGILKGIGITSGAIEFSYILQSFFYAVVGAGIGIFVIYALLVPAFNAHPIDFPFSDGILSAPWSGTMIRFFLLLIVTLFAGYIPARMIVKKNTLDSILGR